MNNIDNPYFCAGKWEELFLYLHYGTTSSCHHPPAHKIPMDELKNNIASLHNTKQKLNTQKLMSDGFPVNECEICWDIEQQNCNIISDRMQKNKRWSTSVPVLTPNINHIPKFIEISFDNLCNLTCSYCNPGPSSSWASEITRTPYNLYTDHNNLYQSIPESLSEKTYKIFLDAWYDWWNEIKYHVEILKFSGGEPLISPSFWKTIDALKSNNSNNSNLILSVNSNMCVDEKYIKKLASYSPYFKSISIRASIDATHKIAEFSRGGLNYNHFLNNTRLWCENTTNNCTLSLQSTINIFGIWGFMDLVLLNLKLRKQYPSKINNMYNTIVKFPEFQSILLLPENIKKYLHHKNNNIFNNVKHNLLPIEREHIFKHINYINMNLSSITNINSYELKQDLITFLIKYQKLIGLNINDIYPKLFTDWLFNDRT